MKPFLLLILSILFSRLSFSQDNEQLSTETYYHKWQVTYTTKEFFVNIHKSDNQDTGKGGITIMYFPLTMIDDGIFGSMGIVFSKEKKPSYVFELSFPIGIGNNSYEDLYNTNMDILVLLMSGKDSIMKSANYESMEDVITIKGIAFKSRLYRFIVNEGDFKKMEYEEPDKLQINFKTKVRDSKTRTFPAAREIKSENAMIHKFSSFANSIAKVTISEVN